MKIFTEPILLTSLLPATCGICYGMILMLNPESRAKRMLGLVFLIAGFCWGISSIIDNLHQQNGHVPIVKTWHILSDLVQWPVIFWYFIVLLQPDAKFFSQHYKQFIPFIVGVPCAFLIRWLFPPAPDIYSVKEYFILLFRYPELTFKLIMIIILLIQAIYFYSRTNKQLKEYQQRVKNDFSEMENVDLRWVYFVNFMFFLALILNLTLAFTSDVQMRTCLGICGFFYNGATAIIGGTRKDIYYLPDVTIPLDKQPLRMGNVALYIPEIQEKVKMNNQIYDKIREGLIELFDKQEIYCKPNLRLDDLAAMLHTNKTYVSTVINEHFHVNFYTLVNNYRIKKALILLEDPTVQIKNIWTQAGFNSQSSFNALFKKEMQMTPSEWMKNKK